MKRCPKCGGREFLTSAHVVQEWKVDENGNYIETTEDCMDVAHYPDNEDMWEYVKCGYAAEGSDFEIKHEEK